MSKSLELQRLCIYSFCSKLEKTSHLQQSLHLSQRQRRVTEGMKTSWFGQGDHPHDAKRCANCSNCEYCVWIWSLDTVRLRGGETRLAGFFRQVHRHQAYHKQVNNWIKVNVIRSLHFPGKLGGILVLTLFMGLLPLRTQECR